MSVTTIAMGVTSLPIVQTSLDHLTAAVSLDTLEMDGTFAQVHPISNQILELI